MLTHAIRLQSVLNLQITALNPVIRLILASTIVIWLSACNRKEEVNPVRSDSTLTQTIDSLFTKSMQEGTVPGMNVVIIKDGKTFFQKSFGYANLQTKTPVTNDTRFAIGSTTKAMTSIAVLELVDKGMLRLDEKVTTYLPDFKMKDMRYTQIQVKHLLSHSSGLTSFATLTPPDASPHALEGILSILANEELAFTPGQDFYYSNYGTTLAGLIVQRVSGIAYEAYMKQNLFDKIGMSGTTLEYWQPDALQGAKGYVYDSTLHQPIETAPYFNRTYSPAGAATITTSKDVARYLTTLVTGMTTPGGEKLLSDSLTVRMFTGFVNADQDGYVQFIKAQGATYGFGWYNINRNGYTTIEHGGNILSFLSYFFIDPKTKSAVGILVNREDFSKAEVAAQVARLVFTEQQL